MPAKVIENSVELGNAIKCRRNILDLTIEEAALRAGIGTKTWSRYESGESIRRDKVRGLCKALGWTALPEVGNNNIINVEMSFDEYRNNEAWSPYIEKHFGKYAALSFVIGSEILLDEVNDDLAALSEKPRGTHIGEIPFSLIAPLMPEQFLMRYDYEFMWALRRTLIGLRRIVPHTNDFRAHSVIEELVLYLILEEAQPLMEEMKIPENIDDEDEYTDWKGWIYDMFDDMDLITCLYSNMFMLTPNEIYHFENWFKEQSYISNDG